MAFKQKNNPFKKKGIDLTKNTPKQNRKLMQEYKDKHMRRTRPLKEGEFETKGAPYDPEGALIQGIKSLDKKLKRLFK